MSKVTVFLDDDITAEEDGGSRVVGVATFPPGHDMELTLIRDAMGVVKISKCEAKRDETFHLKIEQLKAACTRIQLEASRAVGLNFDLLNRINDTLDILNAD